MKCPNCGAESDSKFCPECGTPMQDIEKCPKCGTERKNGVKFCPECGYNFNEQTSAPVKDEAAVNSQAPSENTEESKKEASQCGKKVSEYFAKPSKSLYEALYTLPAYLFAVLSVIMIAVCGGAVAKVSESGIAVLYGTAYNLPQDMSSLTGSTISLVIFSFLSLIAAAFMFVCLYLPAIKAKKLNLGKTSFSLYALSACISGVLLFVIFVLGCTICAQVSSLDGGMGILKAGSCPALTVTFSLIFGLVIACCPVLRCVIAKKQAALQSKEAENIVTKEQTFEVTEEAAAEVTEVKEQAAVKESKFVKFCTQPLPAPFTLLRYASAFLFAVFSLLLFMFFAAPVGIESEEGVTTSYGCIYNMSGDGMLSDLQACRVVLILFAVLSLIAAVFGLLCLYLPALKAKKLGSSFSLYSLFLCIAGALTLAIFITGCAASSTLAISWLGFITGGACLTLIIVFSLFFGIALGGLALARWLLAAKYPALKQLKEGEMQACSQSAAAHKKDVEPEVETVQEAPAALEDPRINWQDAPIMPVQPINAYFKDEDMPEYQKGHVAAKARKLNKVSLILFSLFILGAIIALIGFLVLTFNYQARLYEYFDYIFDKIDYDFKYYYEDYYGYEEYLKGVYNCGNAVIVGGVLAAPFIMVEGFLSFGLTKYRKFARVLASFLIIGPILAALGAGMLAYSLDGSYNYDEYNNNYYYYYDSIRSLEDNYEYATKYESYLENKYDIEQEIANLTTWYNAFTEKYEQLSNESDYTISVSSEYITFYNSAYEATYYGNSTYDKNDITGYGIYSVYLSYDRSRSRIGDGRFYSVVYTYELETSYSSGAVYNTQITYDIRKSTLLNYYEYTITNLLEDINCLDLNVETSDYWKSYLNDAKVCLTEEYGNNIPTSTQIKAQLTDLINEGNEWYNEWYDDYNSINLLLFRGGIAGIALGAFMFLFSLFGTFGALISYSKKKRFTPTYLTVKAVVDEERAMSGKKRTKALNKKLYLLSRKKQTAQFNATVEEVHNRYIQWDINRQIAENEHKKQAAIYKYEHAVAVSQGRAAPLEMNGEGGFDGWLIQKIGWSLLCSFVTLITLGIAYPFTLCWKQRWLCKHTVYKGQRLSFDGNGLQLLGKWICWILLSIVTLTIYAWFIPIRMEKWKAKHTHLAGENKELGGTFDGWLIQKIGWSLLCSLVTLVTLGIAYPFTLCWKQRWQAKHTVYDGVRLKFDGNGLQLIGKWICWILLSVVTLTIYAWFIPIRMQKWKAKHMQLLPPEPVVEVKK